MNFTNNSIYPDDEVRQLVGIGFGGISSENIRVIIFSGLPSVSGTAYFSPRDAEHLKRTVVIRLNGGQRVLLSRMGAHRHPTLPDAELETWRDVLVYVTAHEADHIFRYDQYGLDGEDLEFAMQSRQIGLVMEAMADATAIKKLNLYRMWTGRDPYTPATRREFNG